jgi:SAM-dependent methyltransferase
VITSAQMTLPAKQAEIIAGLERSARYLWAARMAEGRSVLDLGCGEGAGAALLSAVGASRVLGIDVSPDAIERARSEHGDVARFEVGKPSEPVVGDDEFDVVTCFGPLEDAGAPDAVLAAIARALRPDGVLLASLSLARSGEGRASAEAIRRRFRSVRLHEGRRSVIAAASNAPLPAPYDDHDDAGLEAIEGLEVLGDSLSEWEERAREAEAEVAVMRWEVRITGEKLVALVNRLVELENAPTRRLRRRLRSEPGRVSAADVTRAASAAGRISSAQE